MTNSENDPAEPEDPEIEYSVHSGWHSKDGIKIEVQIYRTAGTDGQWTLEVGNKFGGSTIWDDTFSTDDSAYSEFLATLAKEGIEHFEFDNPIVH